MQTYELQFDSLMDILIGLPLIEKQEIFHILKRNIAEEKRVSIKQSYLESKQELESGKLVFGNEIDSLKQMARWK